MSETSKPENGASSLLAEERKSTALHHLEKILESPQFRTSNRPRECLRFIVEQALDGHLDALKERCIGTQVFGRAPSYDTGADSVVRATVNDLRKKLAQYYMEADEAEPVRISLPVGSYIPEFIWHGDAMASAAEPALEEPLPPPARRFHPRWLVLPAAALVIVATFAIYRQTRPVPSVVEEFWSPARHSTRPVLICVGTPEPMLLSLPVQEDYWKAHPGPKGEPIDISLLPPLTPGRDVVPAPDLYIGIGDGQALVHLTSLFVRLGTPYQVRIGAEVSFSDLRSWPTVFIGAFSNRWNLEMTKGLRFTFETTNGRQQLKDWAHPERSFRTPVIPWNGRTPLDYALVSRIFDTATGEPLFQVAGITTYGTQSAGELLTNSRELAAAVKRLPAGWQKKNVQIVLSTRVIGASPGPPHIEAVHCW